MQPRGPILLTAFSLVLCSSIGFGQTLPPLRGVYPLGMNALNAGVMPEPGFTYSNLFLFYSRNQLKGSNGEIVSSGNNSVLMDLNTFVWVTEKTILGGAKLSFTATLIINNNSLSSDIVGPISGGGGFGDSYYQPFILGWQTDRTAIRVIYGFLAPTGKFQAGTNDCHDTPLFFRFNRRPYSQAGRRGFDPRLPLFESRAYPHSHPCSFH